MDAAAFPRADSYSSGVAMSLVATSKQLMALLHDEDVRVIAMSGKWGTGKSHMWREVQNAAISTKVKTAAIVSLFGLSSIEQVKLKLIQSAATQGEKNWRGKVKDVSIPGLAMLEKVRRSQL
nr:P-loop NTPase fold protein [uncultured Roseateles sp.]